MEGQQCKGQLQGPALLVAMKQNYTSLCMCRESGGLAASKPGNLEVEGKELEELFYLQHVLTMWS